MPNAEWTFREYCLDFPFVLSDPIAISIFRAFCEQERSSENLSFVQEVNAFRKIEAPDLRQHVARKICERYLADGAPLALSIVSESARETFQVGGAPVAEDHFAALEREAYQLLRLDVFPRFVDSSFYEELKTALGGESGGHSRSNSGGASASNSGGSGPIILAQPQAAARSTWGYSSQEGHGAYYEGS